MANGRDSIALAVDSILRTWQQGRRVLAVLGAGASVAAEIPKMTTVFQYLAEAVKSLSANCAADLDRLELRDEERREVSRSLDELGGWLHALANENAPRSVAAMALGTLQKAHLRTATQEGYKWFYGKLSEIWSDFSAKFVSGEVKSGGGRSPQGLPSSTAALTEILQRISKDPCAYSIKKHHILPKEPRFFGGPLPDRSPSNLHYCVASWTLQGWCDLISLNFDGLTKRALEHAPETAQIAPVVLTEPEAVKNFFLGHPPDSGSAKRVVPIVKVWGDVFHAVCTNQQCPECGVRIPIYELGKSASDKKCSSCLGARHLQIFFTGYEEKEKRTDELMRELLKFVAPRVGCILTVGFSGLWDQALVKFLATVCDDLNREIKSLDDGHKPKRTAWICVDPDEDPPLLQDLAAHGITPTHVCLTGEEFASLFDLRNIPVEDPTLGPIELSDCVRPLPDGKWETMLPKWQGVFPKAYDFFLTKDTYLSQFKYLRQLGIKTQIAMGHGRSGREKDEAAHNRRQHSWGATTLAAIWFRELARGRLQGRELERMATAILFATIHHDIGHLPFTHLAEEIFQEVHWSLDDWGDAFRHDEPVLGNCIDSFRDQICESAEHAAQLVGTSPHEFQIWVEGVIQGRSGFPWIDAILNSPLDVDKLDYVFRDCDFLDQEIHITTSTEQRHKWIKNLFKHTRVLPSGLVALEGEAGGQARDFLEERRWLYKHQYFQPGYRALERLAGAVTLQWLLHWVPNEIAGSEWQVDVLGRFKFAVADTSAKKGLIARELLWDKLCQVEADAKATQKGEPGLLLKLVADLTKRPPRGLPPSDRVMAWASRCEAIFKAVFEKDWRVEGPGHFTLLQFLVQHTGVTCSESFYVSFDDLPKVREIVRELETLRPFRALFDIAVMPRMLSYPARRRLRWHGETVLGECFAVAHKDPDRWEMPTARWIPMSESAFAERDKARWARIMVVSPESNDPEVSHAVDRFRTICRQKSIAVKDVDPDETMS
jgi:hypothetical protein